MTWRRGRRRAPVSAARVIVRVPLVAPHRRVGRRRRLLAACAAIAAAACAMPLHAGGCVIVSAGTPGATLGAWPLPAEDAVLRLRYRHSVTLSPVEERYDVAGSTLVQTQIRFAEHGPGLPTQAEPGQAWSQEDGEFVLRLARPLDGIAARVDPAQQPTLAVGARTIDLAQWGRRAIHLTVRPGRCPGD